MSRVYTSHQKVVLEVDFSGALWVRDLLSLPFATLTLELGIHGNHHHTEQQRAQDHSPSLQAVQYVLRRLTSRYSYLPASR